MSPSEHLPLGVSSLHVLVPFGRVRFKYLVRPRDERYVLDLYCLFKKLSQDGQLLQYLGTRPMGSITADFLEFPGPKGPGLTLPLRPGTDLPHRFGEPIDPIYFIVPRGGVERTADEVQAQGASSASDPFTLEGVDGAHRNGAASLLCRDPSVPEFNAETLVLMQVRMVTVQKPLSRVEQALSAVDANFSLLSSRTFQFDDSYALLAVRDAALEAFLAEQPLEETPDSSVIGRTALSVLTILAICGAGSKRRALARDFIASSVDSCLKVIQARQITAERRLSLAALLMWTEDVDSEGARDGGQARTKSKQVTVVEYLRKLLSVTEGLSHMWLRFLAHAAGADSGARRRGSGKGEALAVADNGVREHILDVMRAEVSPPALQRIDAVLKEKGPDSPLARYVQHCKAALDEVQKQVVTPTNVTLGTRKSKNGGIVVEDKGLHSEGRAYASAVRVMPYPLRIAAEIEEGCVADSFLKVFPLGPSTHGLKPILPHTVIRLYALHTCFVHREDDGAEGRPYGTSGLKYNGSEEEAITPKWSSPARLLYETKVLVPGDDTEEGDSGAKGREMGKKSKTPYKTQATDAWQAAAAHVQDSVGWSFALVLGLMTRCAGNKGSHKVTSSQRLMVAVLAAWTTAFKRVLGFQSLAATVAPYCTLSSTLVDPDAFRPTASKLPIRTEDSGGSAVPSAGRKWWQLSVPTDRDGRVLVKLAPKSFAVSLLRRSQSSEQQQPQEQVSADADEVAFNFIDTRSVTDWAESLGPIVRASGAAAAGSATEAGGSAGGVAASGAGADVPSAPVQQIEAGIAAVVIRDAEFAGLLGAAADSEVTATVTVAGLMEAPPPPKKGRLGRSSGKEQTVVRNEDTIAAALRNAFFPERWSRKVRDKVVDVLLRHPKCCHKDKAMATSALLGDHVPSEEDREHQRQHQQETEERQKQGQQDQQQDEQLQHKADARQPEETSPAAKPNRLTGKRTTRSPDDESGSVVAEEDPSQDCRGDKSGDVSTGGAIGDRTSARSSPGSNPPPLKKRAATLPVSSSAPHEHDGLWAGPSLETMKVDYRRVIADVLTALNRHVLVLCGDATKVLEAMKTDNLRSVSDAAGLRSHLGDCGIDIRSDSVSIDLSPSETVVGPGGTGSAFPKLWGPDFAGVQLLLTDPPYGVRASDALPDNPRPQRRSCSPAVPNHDTALSEMHIVLFCRALQGAASKWARAAVILPESRLTKWKDAMTVLAHTRGGEKRSPPESIVVCYETPAPATGYKRRRGDNATAIVRATEFVIQTPVVATGESVSRGRAAASRTAEDPACMADSVNLGGDSMMAGHRQPRDLSHVTGVQRPAHDEHISSRFKRAFRRGAWEENPDVESDDAAELESCPEAAADIGQERIRSQLRPEQKSEFLMAELFERLRPRSPSAGTVVVDPFAGTLSTAVAVLALGSHVSLVVSDVDANVLDVGMQRLIVRALHLALAGAGIFSEVARNDCDREVLCRVLAQATARTASQEAKKCIDWGSLPGGDGPLPLFPRMPSHMMEYFLSSGVRQPPRSHPFFHDLLFATASKALFETDALRPAAFQTDAFFYGLHVAASRKLKDSSGNAVARSVFAAKDFTVGQVVAPFYGAYSFEPGTGKSFAKSRFDGLHSVGELQAKYATETEFPEKLPVWGSRGCVFVTPALFSVAAYVNDPRENLDVAEEAAANVTVRAPTLQWLTDVVDAESEAAAMRKDHALRTGTSAGEDGPLARYYSERLPPAGWDVTKARATPLLAARELMMRANCVELVAKTDIASGEELFFNYGNKYNFHC